MSARSRFVIGVGALLIMGSAAGVAYGAVQSSAITASTQDVIRQTSTYRYLRHAGGEANKVTILSAVVPEGNWVLTASVDPVSNFANSGDIYRCALYKGATKLSQHASQVPGGADNNIVQSMTLISSFSSPSASQTVSLKCWHDNAMAESPYLDKWAVLWAHKSTSISKV